MNQVEKYEFDRLGYLVIPGLLDSCQVKTLALAIDNLAEHALLHLSKPPRKISHAFGGTHNYHANEELGYHAIGEQGKGKTLIIEDFWNADPAFDLLLDHAPTMSYVTSLVQERPTINNSELRVRYPGNATGAHMGGPAMHKYRYSFNNGEIDCMMIRMIYFIQDVDSSQGAFCVVPGTHKSHYHSPYTSSPDEEPGMIGLEVKAGDAIIFTENLRHGGLTNHSEQTRKTLHVGYGPYWLYSQNIATMEERPFITARTQERLSSTQNALFDSAFNPEPR